ncbi:hypothetical protein Cni_G21038 [Canna indica]|uniref:Uncharacterized protein n=1 Tax=Canna indica TaxID=4628 RepID=A0AAQ3KV19_9LILI|nr:hypothetical protein Cni_G21038 [Canna indica]
MSQKVECSSGGHRRCGGQQQCCGLGGLVRKLRKQSKMYLCMAPSRHSPAAFRCQYQYDPLSYSRNFDPNHNGFEDDSSHFYYSFSSRFVNSTAATCSPPSTSSSTAAAAPPPPVLVTTNN